MMERLGYGRFKSKYNLRLKCCWYKCQIRLMQWLYGFPKRSFIQLLVPINSSILLEWNITLILKHLLCLFATNYICLRGQMESEQCSQTDLTVKLNVRKKLKQRSCLSKALKRNPKPDVCRGFLASKQTFFEAEIHTNTGSVEHCR